MFEPSSYSKIIQNHFEIRRSQNEQYSLRAFARDLGIASSNLSEILRDKKGISIKTALDIAKKLKLNESEKELFINLVSYKCARSKTERLNAKTQLVKIGKGNDKTPLKEDTFKVISDWYHFAILELMTVQNFQSDLEWIASELSITLVETASAIDRLLKLGLIKNVNGKYFSTNAQLDTTSEIPSHSIQKFNQQILSKAMKAITHQNVEERDLSTLTIAVNTEDLDFIKKRIHEFKHQLDKEIMERTKQKSADKVYCFSTQLFSLQEHRNE